jgi:hypothetical protein
MTAPWGVELDEDILGWVHDELLEFSSDKDGDWFIIWLWWCLGLEMWLNSSSQHIISELSNIFDSQVSCGSWCHVLLHTLWHDGSEGWEVSGGNTDEFSKSLLDSISNTRVTEEDLSLVGSGSLLEGLLEGRFTVAFGSEQEKGRFLLIEDEFNLVIVEGENSWDHQWAGKCSECISCGLTGVWDLLSLELSE